MRLGSVFTIFVLFIAALCVVSCKRDIETPAGVETSLTQREIEIKWAEAHSGRWYSYAIRETLKQSEKEQIDTMQYLGHLLGVSTRAKSHYKDLLVSTYGENLPVNVDRYLDSIYSQIYVEMDEKMQNPSYMRNLFISYGNLLSRSPKLSNKVRKLAAIGIDEVVVTRCGIPQEIYDLKIRIEVLIPHIYELELCRAYAIRTANDILKDIYSPDGGSCFDLRLRAINLLRAYDDCMSKRDPEGSFPDIIGGGGGYPSNPTYTKPTNEQIKNQIKDKPFALFGNLDCDIVRKWVETARHQVQQAQIDKLNSVVNNIVHVSILGTPAYKIQDIAHVQSINNAYSTVVNMDYFPIRVSQLPVVDGQRLTASQFKEYIRKNINSFVNTAYSKFEPYRWHGINDEFLWNSVNPLNTMIGIDIGGPDNGTVIVSKHNNTGWTFTTVYDPKYGIHPVSGNRDFGYFQNLDGSYTFYTRGVDRLTTGVDASMQNVAFFAADELWKSFQQKVKSFVDGKQGSAAIGTPDIQRPDWVKVKDVVDGKKPLSTLSSDCND